MMFDAKRRRVLAIAAICTALAACTTAPGGPPERMAVDAGRLDSFMQAVRADVERGRYPGAVVMVAQDGKVLLEQAVGWADAGKRVPMALDSIHPIASSTKLITTVAALRLVEANRLRVFAPIATYLPELAQLKVLKPGAAEPVAAARQPTVHDLMTHRAGFTYFFFPPNSLRDRYRELGIDRVDNGSAAEMLQRLAPLPLAFDPGTSFEYSIATDLLGHIIERVTGQPLDRALDELVLSPLGMRDTTFHVQGAALSRFARPQAGDPDSWVFEWLDLTRAPTRFSGGAGMASTVGDYLKVLTMLLNEGEYGGVRLLSPATVRWALADHVGTTRGVAHPGDGYAWNLFNPVRTAAGLAAFPGSVGDIFWGGITGPRYFMDPRQRLIGLFFMQRPSERAAVHAEFRAAVYGAMRPAPR